MAGHRYHFGVSHNSAPPRRRRVVYTAESKSQGRSGCVITGAVLGIIVGATFAFYGLPPILRHYYGEKHIAIGAPYTGDGKTISVTRSETTPDPAADSPAGQPGARFVTVLVSTNKTWTPVPADFQLQYEEVGDWIEAGALAVDHSSAGGGLAVGQDVHLFLTFPLPASKPDAKPLYLHLSDPRVRFALP